MEYRLTNKDQCETIVGGQRVPGTDPAIAGVPSATISDLISYSTYEVFIYALNSYGDGPEASVTGMTSADCEYLVYFLIYLCLYFCRPLY